MWALVDGLGLVRGGSSRLSKELISPVWLPMLELPSMDQTRRWYNSEEFSELKQVRLAATVSNGFFMTGT